MHRPKSWYETFVNHIGMNPAAYLQRVPHRRERACDDVQHTNSMLQERDMIVLYVSVVLKLRIPSNEETLVARGARSFSVLESTRAP